jgi:hypothetical protein
VPSGGVLMLAPLDALVVALVVVGHSREPSSGDRAAWCHFGTRMPALFLAATAPKVSRRGVEGAPPRPVGDRTPA